METDSEGREELQLLDMDPSSLDTGPNNTKDKRTEQLVKQLIQELPKQLRRDRWIRTSKALCDTHQGLNANLTHEIFWLVQREVGQHLVKFDAYPELLKPLDKVIVAQLKSIRGMWEKPAADCASEPGAWIYETSKCQACMLARIASDKETLRNLRTALLSRTQTRVNHVRRRLMKFVDSCIDHFQEDLDEMHSVSSYFAHIFKATRKACTKAWYMDPAHADTRQLHRHHKIGDKDLDKPGKEGSDGIHKCAKKCHPQAPPVILETHPAESRPVHSSPLKIQSKLSYKRLLNSLDAGKRAPAGHQNALHLALHSGLHPDRVIRFVDPVEGRKYSFHRDNFYRPPGNPLSPRIPSADFKRPDALDEMISMYKTTGSNPYQGRPAPLSICSTDCEWSDDELDTPNAHESPAGATTAGNLLCEPEGL